MEALGWSANRDAAALKGVGLMLCVAVLGAVDSALTRALSPDVHPFVMGFTRALFGLLAFAPFILRRPAMLRSHYRFRHALRAGLKLAALIAYFFAFASAPLAEVTAIAFASPVFVAIGAWLFLKERLPGLRVVAVALGFVGVLLVLRPDAASGSARGIEPGLAFALLGAALTAVIQLILKPMSARDSTDTLVAWNLIITAPLAAIPAVFVWAAPDGREWALLALQGVLGALAMGCATRAFSLADASLIAPVEFVRLPMAALLGWLFFAQAVPPATWIGAGSIFAATLLMARSARRPRNNKAADRSG